MTSEKRRDHRFNIPNSRQDGELRFGKIRLPIQLFDQSAGGFAAISWSPPGVEIGGTGLLRTGDDWYEIRLVYVTPIDHPDADEASTLDEQQQCFRVGLFRLGDTVDPDKKAEGWSWPTLRNHFEDVMPPHSSMLGFGMLFITAMVVLPIVAILFMRNVKGDFVGDESGLEQRIAATANFDESDADWEKLAPANQSGAKWIFRSEDNPVSLGRLSNFKEELLHIIPRNPGASVFLLPQVVRQLHITGEQQRQLQQIVDATSQLAADMEGQSNEALSPDQCQNLFNAARGKAMQSLTDEQRSKWQNMLGEKPQNKSPRPAKDDK